MIRQLAAAGKLLLDLLFPRRCLWCNEVIGFTACATCNALLASATRADAAVPQEGRVLHALDGVYAPFWYASPVSNAILACKYGGRQVEAAAFAALLQECLQARGALLFDAVVPVPKTKRERRASRSDLPYLLARKLAQKLHVPFAPQLLRKTRETRRQMTLSGEARRKNMQGAFAAGGEITGKCILLVDDVVTTGATLHACACALQDAGAARVYAVVLAATRT